MSLLQRLEKKQPPEVSQKPAVKGEKKEAKDHFAELKVRIHKKVIDQLGKELAASSQNGEEENQTVAEKVKTLAEDVLDSEQVYLSTQDRKKLIDDVIDDAIGFGPIHPLLRDSSITEVMVNGPNTVYVERNGCLEKTSISFRDNTHVMNVIEKIVSPLGRRIDESSPMVDARLPDGSRVNAVIPPLSLNGPVLTIRKFAEDPLTIDDLISFGTITEQVAYFIEACVRARLNIVVSGGTGSGKTTTLNVLSSFIPSNERIVTIEDAAELQLRQEHVLTLETRPPNIEGQGAVTVRDLVRNALRMRPDRIVVGEVRSGEALDMLQAMNTGHDGSLTTGHANSPRDMLSRLETMVLMAGMDLPVKAIREQVSSAIDLIVQQSRFRDGSRRITKITEVQGLEGDIVVMQDLFSFAKRGMDENGKILGELKSTGIRPKFIEKLEIEGITLGTNVFSGGW